MIDDLLFDYVKHAEAFLRRAEAHFASFENEENVASFFYAALELRFGIEARINEYLAPALKRAGQPTAASEYVASRLLKRLAALDPRAPNPAHLRATNLNGGQMLNLAYTPVSPRLASLHGQLGELLHYKFFPNNQFWAMRSELGGKPYRSLRDYAGLLAEVIAELRTATSGNLLSNPSFEKMVEEELKGGEAEAQPSVPPDEPASAASPLRPVRG